MNPMLASAADLAKLRYPVLASPKLDGVRCGIIDGVAVGRSLKAIPNKHVQDMLGLKQYNNLDGELIVGRSYGLGVFQRTTSGVMSVDGLPDFALWVFDDFTYSHLPFEERLYKVGISVRNKLTSHVRLVPHKLIRNRDQLDAYEEKRVARGYEGIMLRDPRGLYKHGRSTVNEGWLLKLKRFEDSEARVVGVAVQLRNLNEAKVNVLGQTERSSHKVNKVPKGVLGALRVKDIKTGVEFDVGTGYTDPQRAILWKLKEKLPGLIIKYRFQPAGVKDLPRFPVFLGFRDPLDM